LLGRVDQGQEDRRVRRPVRCRISRITPEGRKVAVSDQEQMEWYSDFGHNIDIANAPVITE
jgi:hypothetical protein